MPDNPGARPHLEDTDNKYINATPPAYGNLQALFPNINKQDAIIWENLKAIKPTTYIHFLHYIFPQEKVVNLLLQ